MSPRSSSRAGVDPNAPFRLSDQELAASCESALADWDGRSPVWVFGYGSLIWRPELAYDRRLPARVYGYHRRLCLRSVLYRGTPSEPGIVAGLDRGGCCAGVALRLPAASVRDQFLALWQREMFLGSYAPRWLRPQALGRPAEAPPPGWRALAFVVRRDAPNYCGTLPADRLLHVLAHARGQRGSSLDYLVQTVDALRREGLRDPHLERLLDQARRHPQAGPQRPAPDHPKESDR